MTTPLPMISLPNLTEIQLQAKLQALQLATAKAELEAAHAQASVALLTHGAAVHHRRAARIKTFIVLLLTSLAIALICVAAWVAAMSSV